MARHGGETFYLVAADPAAHGARLLAGCDVPTRTVTADGSTWRCEWVAVAGAVAVTQVDAGRSTGR